MDGNTYELIIDSKKLPKGLYSAIEGIRRTSKKNQQLILVDETDPKIFDDKSRFENPEGVPSPSDVSEKLINLGEGREVYNTKSSNRQNPFIPALSKIEPSVSENTELRWFKNAVVKAKSVDELNKVIDQALSAGIRINAYSEGQKSFADTVISKMSLIKCKENEKEDIICELMLNGAIFRYDLLQDKGISEMHNKLYQV
ncbi:MULTISPECIES: hypothetical protein [unclassified Wolbachia]|uniref:hypothetical protein n=1 Tax=unclassified Wolbachia TaxID=2640676 RepID=UPI001FE4D08E|nr:MULTISPECIES: hypothetical protein [unclassified Wolbachia]